MKSETLLIAAGAVLLYTLARKTAPVIALETEIKSAVSNVRGIRNNNLLNIRHDPRNDWQGMVGVDNGGFVVFDSVLKGLRAGFIILRNYKKAGADSIATILERFAPRNENDTDRYIVFVANAAGIDPRKVLSQNETKRVLQAMVKMETGANVSSEQIEQAYKAV